MPPAPLYRFIAGMFLSLRTLSCRHYLLTAGTFQLFYFLWDASVLISSITSIFKPPESGRIRTALTIIPISLYNITEMDYFLIITGTVLMLTGIAGCILPMLPGPPLSFAGLLLLQFTGRYQFSGGFLLTWSLITLAVTLIDYWIPSWGARKFGAGRPGVWGSVIGLLAGLIFFPPFGIIIGPFAGAVIGESLSGKSSRRALKAGFGSFVGIFAGTLCKLTASGMMAWYFLKTLTR